MVRLGRHARTCRGAVVRYSLDYPPAVGDVVTLVLSDFSTTPRDHCPATRSIPEPYFGRAYTVTAVLTRDIDPHVRLDCGFFAGFDMLETQSGPW